MCETPKQGLPSPPRIGFAEIAYWLQFEQLRFIFTPGNIKQNITFLSEFAGLIRDSRTTSASLSDTKIGTKICSICKQHPDEDPENIFQIPVLGTNTMNY